jgi:hypothetical protein
MSYKNTLQKIQALIAKLDQNNLQVLGRAIGLGKIHISSHKSQPTEQNNKSNQITFFEEKDNNNKNKVLPPNEKNSLKQYLKSNTLSDNLEEANKNNHNDRDTYHTKKYTPTPIPFVLIHFIDLVIVVTTCFLTLIIMELTFFDGISGIKKITQLYDLIKQNNISIWYILVTIYLFYIVYYVIFKIFIKKTIATLLIETLYKQKNY